MRIISTFVAIVIAGFASLWISQAEAKQERVRPVKEYKPECRYLGRAQKRDKFRELLNESRCAQLGQQPPRRPR